MSDVVRLDGSKGEGGGQILRSALTLSILTGRPFAIANIRANRDKPGLRPQHLEGVRAAQRLCGAVVEGDRLASRSLSFHPGPVRAGDYAFEIGTAGSAALVLHVAYLPLALAGVHCKVEIAGGTHNAFAPCGDYLVEAWAPAIRTLGFAVEVRVPKLGFYPRGGGQIVAVIEPFRDKRQTSWMNRGELQAAQVVSVVAQLDRGIADRQAARAAEGLKGARFRKILRPAIIEERPAGSPGTMLGIRCRFETGQTFFFGLGERGKRAEVVADEAVEAFEDFLKAEDAPVDPHLADQLLLPAIARPGAFSFRTSEATKHLVTNADVIERFVERKIRIDGKVGRPATVEVSSA